MKEKPEPKFDPFKSAYQSKDSREGRLHDVKSDRGKFRFKDNRKDE